MTAAIDATLTMLPRPPRFIAPYTARVIWYAPTVFTE